MTHYTYTLQSLPKSTSEIDLHIEWDKVRSTREKVINDALAQVQVPGYRRGKAPREMAQPYLHPEKIYEQVVRRLVPEIYQEIIKKEKIQPISTPAIELKEAKEDAPWHLVIKVPLYPQVVLKDYKQSVRAAHAKASADSPKKGSTDKGDAEAGAASTPPKASKSTHTHPSPTDSPTPAPARASFAEICEVILSESEVEVPELLIHEEVDRRLAKLASDITKLGLSLPQYLESKGMTEEKLRTQLFRESEDMYRLEFALAKIAELESLTVDDAELAGILGQAKTDYEKRIAAQNMDWYATLLRKQKVLDFLTNL